MIDYIAILLKNVGAGHSLKAYDGVGLAETKTCVWSVPGVRDFVSP